ncbi:hypothetical protein MKY96_33160 [Paenibacillus sp. FSL R7-0302]|uniref:hypothetical protein n=1 Tax=Paenibacillus sp. FSL R7-0302 TaxID=2921681 RepID=UPI0030F8B82A
MSKFKMKSKLFSNYSSALVDRVYKILPLYEEKNEGLFAYVQSLIYELEGLYWAVEGVRDNPDYLTLVGTLESLSEDVMFFDMGDHSVVKREVFKCLEVVKKIKTTSESGE